MRQLKKWSKYGGIWSGNRRFPPWSTGIPHCFQHVQEENGQRTYVMLDFTEDSGLKTIRYTMDGDQCIRTEYTQYYNEYIDYEDEDEDEQMLEIHNPADYMQSDYYWWEVDGNTLTLEKEENEKEVVTTYHALTKTDAALMAELEKKSKQ